MLVTTRSSSQRDARQSAAAPPGKKLRVLVFSTLYPSAARARHGIFVETRLRHLLALGDVDARVIAAVPWFPSTSPRFGRYSEFAATPRHELRFGVDIAHPRYLMLPKIGWLLQPRALASSGLQAVRSLQRQGFDPDVIDAHYFYPDGVAAAELAATLSKPLVITARGSDLNLLAQNGIMRGRMLNAAERAHRVICVSAALRDRALEIGAPPDKLEVLRNGVDGTFFHPMDKAESRRTLGLEGLSGPLLLAVGNLVAEKDHAWAVDTLALLPDAKLVIIGDGPLHASLLARAGQAGVAARVSIRPPMAQENLRRAYSVADVLLLTSSREGWPNVLLEAMACGTPVVAAAVGGAPEIVSSSSAARLVHARTPEALRDAIVDLLRSAPHADAARRHALTFDWRSVVTRYRDILNDAASLPVTAHAASSAAA